MTQSWDWTKGKALSNIWIADELLSFQDILKSFYLAPSLSLQNDDHLEILG